MASVVHLFGAPKRRLSMEEVETADAVTDFGFAGCAHAKKSSTRQVLLVDKETLDAMDLQTGDYPRKHHHRRHQREWPGIGRTVAHWFGTSASECMRSTGKGTAGLAPRNIWQARDVVPSLARWNNSRRRPDRARGSGFLVSP